MLTDNECLITSFYLNLMFRIKFRNTQRRNNATHCRNVCIVAIWSLAMEMEPNFYETSSVRFTITLRFCLFRRWRLGHNLCHLNPNLLVITVHKNINLSLTLVAGNNLIKRKMSENNERKWINGAPSVFKIPPPPPQPTCFTCKQLLATTPPIQCPTRTNHK